jgi:predicted transcriptional regulator
VSIDERSEYIVRLTSGLVVAYVSNNAVPQRSLPDLIAEIHDSLNRLQGNAQMSVEQKQKPAVAIRKSVTEHYVVCLDDGKKFKSLRRHLATLGMTPDQYRQRWGLPVDYPMVAPAYAASRSELAKKNGLGRRPRITKHKQKAA